MRVVASSTTAGATQENAQESARAVMNAILDCSVNRGGESVQVRGMLLLLLKFLLLGLPDSLRRK